MKSKILQMRWRAQEATGGDRLCVRWSLSDRGRESFPAQNAQEIIIKKVFTAGFRCSYRLSLMRIVARFHTLLLLNECDFRFFLCVFCFRSSSFAHSLPCPSRISSDAVNCTKSKVGAFSYSVRVENQQQNWLLVKVFDFSWQTMVQLNLNFTAATWTLNYANELPWNLSVKARTATNKTNVSLRHTCEKCLSESSCVINRHCPRSIYLSIAQSIVATTSFSYLLRFVRTTRDIGYTHTRYGPHTESI